MENENHWLRKQIESEHKFVHPVTVEYTARQRVRIEMDEHEANQWVGMERPSEDELEADRDAAYEDGHREGYTEGYDNGLEEGQYETEKAVKDLLTEASIAHRDKRFEDWLKDTALVWGVVL